MITVKTSSEESVKISLKAFRSKVWFSSSLNLHVSIWMSILLSCHLLHNVLPPPRVMCCQHAVGLLSVCSIVFVQSGCTGHFRLNAFVGLVCFNVTSVAHSKTHIFTLNFDPLQLQGLHTSFLRRTRGLLWHKNTTIKTAQQESFVVCGLWMLCWKNVVVCGAFYM